MKKILLASSALALTASVAAAEVTVGGDAYYGIIYNDSDAVFLNNATGESQNYAFAFDLDIDFTATGETDSGIVFGASIDADDTAKAQGVRGFDGEVFVSGAFGRLAMGDTDGAAEAVIGDLDAVSLTGLGDFNENIFLLSAGNPSCSRVQDEDGNDVISTDPITGLPNGYETIGACGQGPLALYTYDYGGFTGAIGLNDDEGYSLGAGYDGGAWTIGLGYERVSRGTEITIFDPDGFDSLSFVADEAATHLIGQAGFTFGNTTIKGTYGQIDTGQTAEYDFVNGIPVKTNGNGKFDQYGISLESSFDAFTVGAFYREINNDTPGLKRSFFYGVGASYDLGGGLAVVAGLQGGDVYSQAETPLTTTFTAQDTSFYAADFGLDFSF
ncbi:MAG: porin [Mangrovicoccus sp.]|nr:porin [Mangrovicoccus sp.]